MFSIADQLETSCDLSTGEAENSRTWHFPCGGSAPSDAIRPHRAMWESHCFTELLTRCSFVCHGFSSRLQNNQLTPNVGSAAVKGLICFLFCVFGYFLLELWSSNYVV